MDTPRNRRDLIINSAIDIFSEKGYMETNMKEIAARSGIKASAIYNHFSSKEDILNTILDEYFDVIKQSTVPAEEVTGLIGELDTKSILNKMFFLFKPEQAERYTKILKIITHEQFREERATRFVRDVMFKHNEEYVTNVLDTLADAGKIKPVNTKVFAKILISLTISSSTEMMFYGLEDYQKQRRVSRRDATNYLFDTIICS